MLVPAAHFRVEPVQDQYVGNEAMKRGTLIKVLWRSFFVHAAVNFRRMQNIGFTYALIPFLREKKMSDEDKENFLGRHLQMFNTHPYLCAPLIGSLFRMEEDRPDGDDAASIEMVKNSLTGPYAAIGDTFFWGALRPCAGIVASCVALAGGIVAPVVFLFVYTPAHLWVRIKGFIEGWRRGKQGVEFIRKMSLPGVALRMRWLSVLLLAGMAVWLLSSCPAGGAAWLQLLCLALGLGVILVCRSLLRKGVSQIFILYGGVILLLLISCQDWSAWWK